LIDLWCFIFLFGGAWCFVWWAELTKVSRGNGISLNLEAKLTDGTLKG